MAYIKKGILSNLRGSIGNITGRVRNGKNILSVRPDSYKASQNPAAIIRRNKFKIAIQFSKVIYSNPHLKKLWQSFNTGESSPFNSITKINYRTLEGDKLSNQNTITPPLGFPLVLQEITKSDDSISFSFAPLIQVYNFNTAVEVKVKPILIIHFSSPLTNQLNESLFHAIEVPVLPLQVEDPLIINASLNLFESSLFNRYQEHFIFAALLTLNENDQVINYSDTIFST